MILVILAKHEAHPAVDMEEERSALRVLMEASERTQVLRKAESGRPERPKEPVAEYWKKDWVPVEVLVLVTLGA